MAPPTAVARAQVRRLAQGTYLYPLKGIVFFAAHPYLYPLLRSRLLPAILLSAAVLATLFVWTYLPQVAFLAIFHGRGGAFLNATFLVLGEGAAVTALLFEALLADEALLNVFDTVLVARGCEALVATSRPVLDEAPDDEEEFNARASPSAGAGEAGLRNPRQRLGKLNDRGAVYSPFSLRQIVEFVLLLPLNLIPWIGVPLFLWLTGFRAGPLQHHRYFKLKAFSGRQRKEFVKARQLGYTAFGCVALVLQLVPVLSMVFLLTTAAGSALWVADIEHAQRRQAEGVPDSPPPEYTEYVDDPV